MLKFKIIPIALLIFFYSIKALAANLEIIVFVNNEIITNHDIKKEINYLELLNPELIKISESKKIQIAKNSLINEIIKKQELKKIEKLTLKNKFRDEQFKKIYTRLNFENQREFEKKIYQIKSYNVDEIKEKIDINLNWNELIYSKYFKQVNINQEKINNRIRILANEKSQEYNLSEIVFTKKIGMNISDLFEEIKLSINEIGFSNTANIYSISDSSKFGGKIGWINQNNLSENIIKNLKNLDKDQISEIIKIGNNFLILKLNDYRVKEISIDESKISKDLIINETNRQLGKFSEIYFNQVKKNYSINEK